MLVLPAASWCSRRSPSDHKDLKVPAGPAGAAGSATIADNSVAAVKARATTEAHQREWKNRLGIGDDWSEIANGTAMALGKVVEHGGAYFGCITAHNKGATGPDGDPTNWTLLSAFYGAWSAAWYPAGAFVIHGGSPWIAGQAVINSDPAPDHEQ